MHLINFSCAISNFPGGAQTNTSPARAVSPRKKRKKSTIKITIFPQSRSAIPSPTPVSRRRPSTKLHQPAGRRRMRTPSAALPPRLHSRGRPCCLLHRRVRMPSATSPAPPSNNAARTGRPPREDALCPLASTPGDVPATSSDSPSNNAA
jgi:hypothetical protein